MDSPLHALVAYVRSPLGEFVENLRRELHPEHPDLAAHLTVLPPRHLSGTESQSLEIISDACSKVEPFQVEMGDVESFMPITPTIFIRVAQKAYRLRELHDQMNLGPLAYEEPWPYMPHLTVIKLSELEAAGDAVEYARRRWAEYSGPRTVQIKELTFVRGGCDLYTWSDLAPVSLGSGLAVNPAR